MAAGHIMTITVDQQCQSLYTGGDTTIIAAELRHIIEHAIANQPRSLQVRIGPSELGNSCDRCLISKLAGIDEARDVAWLPFVGTGVHELLAPIFIQHTAQSQRYLVEFMVTVGRIGGQDITGHLDLFDIHLGALNDWKIVGATTLRDAKANGASDVYKIQQHLYGKGLEDAGYTVQEIGVYYLPRNEPTLANAYRWSEPYDRSIAEKAIARADMFANAIQFLGAAKVLTDAAPHTGGYSCNRYDPSLTKPGHPDPAKAFAGLIAS